MKSASMLQRSTNAMIVLIVLILFGFIIRLIQSDSAVFELVRLRAQVEQQSTKIEQLLARSTSSSSAVCVKSNDDTKESAARPVASAPAAPLTRFVDEKDFKAIALRCGTDKVRDHAYEFAYQRYLGPLSLPGTAEFTMIEIGFAAGHSACVWREMLAAADQHSIEIGCTAESRAKLEVDWIVKSPLFDVMMKEGRMHCGDGANGEYMAPILRSFQHPLTVVIDDGGHGPSEMAGSFKYLFPRIAPRGFFFMEDLAESYRVGSIGFVPKFVRPLLEDVHFKAGDSAVNGKELQNLPQLSKFLRSVHCYQHICIFERNDVAAEPP